MIIIEERKPVKLPGLSSLFVSFDWNENIVAVFRQLQGVKSYNKNTKEWEVPVTCLSWLIDTLIELSDIKLRVLHENETLSFSIPEDYPFKFKPFKHQLEGINYGINNPKWLLLDDMGLGKTGLTIMLAEYLHNIGKLDHCLIVCGINSIKHNWIKEINKFSKLSCKILGEKERVKSHKKIIGSVKERAEELLNPIEEFFIVTNIETLREDIVIEALNKNVNNIQMIAFDEAHKSKDPTSKQGSNFLKLKDFSYKIAMSGTLLMNSPLDAYVPLKWIGVENSTYSTYKNYYCEYGGFNNAQVIGYKNLDVLKDEIASCSLRRRKDEVFDLPEKTYLYDYVEMGAEQEKFYNDFIEGQIAEADKIEYSVQNIQAIITRLRQITAWPGVLSTNVLESAKLDRVEELVEQIVAQGDKAVIFSTFKDPIYEAERRLKKYKPLVATGDYKDEEIAQKVDQFQQCEDNKLFLATWQKCGTGLTLTAATYCIFIDTPWTDAEFQQACDRIYRIGTTRPVTIITLITENTWDERVRAIVEGKADLFNMVINGAALSNNASDRLRELLTVKK